MKAFLSVQSQFAVGSRSLQSQPQFAVGSRSLRIEVLGVIRFK